MESRDSKLIADGRAWRVDGRAQALVGPGLATPLANTQGPMILQCSETSVTVKVYQLIHKAP